MKLVLVQNIVMENLAKFDEVMMNFNYLMDPKQRRISCQATNTECYWVPVSPGRSMSGDNVHVSMMCKKCNIRRDIFMTKKEYKTQERIIEREVEIA